MLIKAEVVLEDIEKIEKIIEYQFDDKSLLELAFTHSSFANSHGIASNEKLEFLGDSVLNFCTTKFLFNNSNLNEGDLSKIRAYLVSSEYVSQYIFKNELIKFLRCHNFNPQKSTNVMGDLYESIVGAIFLDSTIENCEKFIFKSLKYSENLISDVQSKIHDYKSELQEYLQMDGKLNLEYMLVEKTGPAHLPEFTVAVKIANKEYGIGRAKSKKEAENIAAKNTLEMIEKNCA